MKQEELIALVAGIAPAVREYVDDAIAKEVATVRQEVMQRTESAMSSIERLATAAIQKQQESTPLVTPADDSAKEAVASMERLAAAAIQKEAPDHLEAIRTLIDGLAEKQAKAVDDLSRRVESLTEKDDGADAYADLLARMTARFEAAHVA
jgi:hypothetical protein